MPRKPSKAGAALTHIDGEGSARMVDVGAKPETARLAVASGRIRMSAEALAAIKAGEWDRFVELANSMAPAMGAIQTAADQRKFDSAAQRSKVEAILRLLEQAIHECSARKDQISPLIDALNRIATPANRP